MTDLENKNTDLENNFIFFYNHLITYKQFYSGFFVAMLISHNSWIPFLCGLLCGFYSNKFYNKIEKIERENTSLRNNNSSNFVEKTNENYKIPLLYSLITKMNKF